MPSDVQLAFASIAEIGRLYRGGKLSPVELTRFLLDRIASLNPRLNAYLTVCEEQALEQVVRAESALPGKRRGKSARDLGPLHGIPISLKDNIYTAGIRTTAGSKILHDFVPLHDAPVATALKKAGAIILGKTNMHEFAYGTTSNNPHYGPVRNPWDETRIAGGSSGGSAAALAAGLCYGSIGTDTGGSIRIPASLCGVVGLKPGLGRVSAEDVIPLSPTLDFVGPLARSVEDVALLLHPIFTRGVTERSLLPRKFPSPRARRAKLGMPKEFFFDVVSPDVQRAFDHAIRILKKGGASIKEISLPLLPETEDAGNQIAWAEATLYHQQAGWFPDCSADYGEDVRSRLEMGTQVSAVSYLKALQTREKFISAFHLALEDAEVDALVVPTTPIAAPPIGEESTSIGGALHPTRALLLRLNRPANLAGVPAISVPCGLTEDGLPVGLQFIAAVTDEPLLLELARDFEHASPLEARPVLD
ncbi:MAG: amidase [Candidatus Acidiferrum sp.]|jgi:aspartyl-tRNA(Asn)/glutamyl-tRNA(Gln) amidotransferase subunit A